MILCELLDMIFGMLAGWGILGLAGVGVYLEQILFFLQDINRCSA